MYGEEIILTMQRAICRIPYAAHLTKKREGDRAKLSEYNPTNIRLITNLHRSRRDYRGMGHEKQILKDHERTIGPLCHAGSGSWLFPRAHHRS